MFLSRCVLYETIISILLIYDIFKQTNTFRSATIVVNCASSIVSKSFLISSILSITDHSRNCTIVLMCLYVLTRFIWFLVYESYS